MRILEQKALSKINQEISQISNQLGKNNILIHSDIKKVNAFNFKDRYHYLDQHLNNIANIFSNFNIWMPVFNYDFAKTRNYDIENDISQVGILNDYFRLSAQWRTTTPIFNFAGNGYPGIKKS